MALMGEKLIRAVVEKGGDAYVEGAADQAVKFLMPAICNAREFEDLGVILEGFESTPYVRNLRNPERKTEYASRLRAVLAQHPNVKAKAVDTLVRRFQPNSMDPLTGEEWPLRLIATMVERELRQLPDELHHLVHEPEIPGWRQSVIRHLEERFGDHLCPTVTAKEVSREFDAGQMNQGYETFARAVAYKFRDPEFAAKYLVGGDPVELDAKTGIFAEDGIPPAERDVFSQIFSGRTSLDT